MMKHTPESWDALFYDIAVRVSERSKDRRKVGAVLVSADRKSLSFGYNGLPANIEDTPENLANQDLRALRMVHAERNCILQRPAFVDWATLYVTRYPCVQCARLLVEAGVRRLVAPQPDFAHPRWGTSWEAAYSTLQFYGIKQTEWPCV